MEVRVAAATVLRAKAAKRDPGAMGMSSVYCALPEVCSTALVLGMGSDTGYCAGLLVKDEVPLEMGRTKGSAAVRAGEV